MAYAGERFVNSLLQALAGVSGIIECAYVRRLLMYISITKTHSSISSSRLSTHIVHMGYIASGD